LTNLGPVCKRRDDRKRVHFITPSWKKNEQEHSTSITEYTNHRLSRIHHILPRERKKKIKCLQLEQGEKGGKTTYAKIQWHKLWHERKKNMNHK